MHTAPQAAEPWLYAGAARPPLEYDADIIILSLGRVQDTIEAVASALNQQRVLTHVFLLDQGSTEAELEAIAVPFENQPNFSFYRTCRNLGVGGGRNFLSSCGRGRFIVSLDNDAVFTHDLVVSQTASRFDHWPILGAIGFKILAADGIALDETSWGYPEFLKPLCQEVFLTTTVVGAGHAILRAAWKKSGGYDERLFFTWEEYDFCLRLLAHGWQIAYDGQLAVRHKAAAEARVAWQHERLGLAVRNRLVIARKWQEPLWLISARMVGYLLRGIANRRIRATVSGIIAAWRFDLGHEHHNMTVSMRAYIRSNESIHRGGWMQRLKYEVFRKLPAG